MQLFAWLLSAILALMAGFWVYRTDRKRATPYPWLTATLRSIVVFAALLLLLLPDINITRNTVEKPVVLLLQDNSASVGYALGKDSTAYRKAMEQLTDKLSADYKVVKWGFGDRVQTDSTFCYTQPTTDISTALTRAEEYFGARNLGAVILASDGLFNRGANPLYAETALHGTLYTVGIGDSAIKRDIKVTRAYANKAVMINSNFEVRADVVADRCNGYQGQVEIKEGGDLLSATPLSVNADRYDRSVSFSVKAAKPGLHHYTVIVTAPDGEENTANNSRDIFVEVIEEKKNILIVSAAPHPDVNALKEALAGVERYKVTVVTAEKMPADLSGYQVIVLHGLPSLANNIAAKITSAHKPLWLIISGETNITALNNMQDITHSLVTPCVPHDVAPVLNTAFNLFTAPQNIAAIADKLPPLETEVGSVTTLPGSGVLFYQKTGQGSVPLWVLQQGAVPVAILCGENIWHWRLLEYKNTGAHDVVDECIRQTIAFLAANSNEKPFTVSMPKNIWSSEDAVSLNATLLNASNEQINTADAGVTITDSAGRKQDYSFERAGNGYALNIGSWAGGTYTYSAHTVYDGKSYTAVGSFVVENTPLELMENTADFGLLYGLAHKYNGSFVPAANTGALYDSIKHNETIKPLIRTDVEPAPLVDRKWFFVVILLFAVGEWLLRKYWLAQ